MLYGRIDENITFKKQDARVAGSSAVTDLLDLHLRLDVVGERSVSACGIAKAGCFDLHLAAIAAVGGAFQIGEAIFFQHRRVGRIRRSRIFGGLHALGVDMPATERLWQWASGSF